MIKNEHNPLVPTATDVANSQKKAISNGVNETSAIEVPGQPLENVAAPEVETNNNVEAVGEDLETVPTNLPDQASQSETEPKPKSHVLVQIRKELGLGSPMPVVPSPVTECSVADQQEPLSPGDEQELGKQILQLWKQHDTCETDLPGLLYQFCVALHAPGRKGQGFEAWLKDNKKPKSTAYRWINKYAKREGLKPPFPVKKKTKTSSQPGRGSKSPMPKQDGVEAESVPVPKDLPELKSLVRGFLERADETERRHWIKELQNWLAMELLTKKLPVSVPNSSSEVA
jgi:hypothetical protein